MAVLEVATDLHCPWSYVCVLRLRRARDALGLDVALRHRYWPLELVNGRVTAPYLLLAEIAVLAPLEPTAFALPETDEWPTTLLPAFELVKAAELQGLRAAEELDAALRRAYFVEHRNLSLRTTLFAIAATVPGLDQAALREAYDSGRTRRVVLEEYEALNRRGIEGIPTVYLPDGQRVLNPGLTVRWVQGLPHVLAEDQTIYEQLLRAAAHPG
jgi:predicted DsbA family dithiol-disulfide isomerase